MRRSAMVFGLAGLIACAAMAPGSALAAQETAAADVSASRAVLLAKARAIGSAMGVERQSGAMLQQLIEGSDEAMIAELEGTAEGREMLVELDRAFPGGRAGFASAFAEELAARFTASLPLYMEKGAELIVDTVAPADLEAWHDAVVGPDGAPRSGEDALRARTAFAQSGAMQRIRTTQSVVIEGLQAFGQSLGERLGIESYDAVAARHPAIFGEKGL